MFQHRILVGHDNVEKKALQDASKLAVEAISNIRTVASLRKEEYFVAEYQKVRLMILMMMMMMILMMMMMAECLRWLADHCTPESPGAAWSPPHW